MAMGKGMLVISRYMGAPRSLPTQLKRTLTLSKAGNSFQDISRACCTIQVVVIGRGHETGQA